MRDGAEGSTRVEAGQNWGWARVLVGAGSVPLQFFQTFDSFHTARPLFSLSGLGNSFKDSACNL